MPTTPPPRAAMPAEGRSPPKPPALTSRRWVWAVVVLIGIALGLVLGLWIGAGSDDPDLIAADGSELTVRQRDIVDIVEQDPSTP